MRTDVARQIRYWSTASAEPGAAFAYWVRTLCTELVELQIKTQRAEHFDAWLLQRALGSVSLNFIYTREPQRAWRTQETINRSSESRFDLLYMRSGSVVFEHYGRNFSLGPNECVLIDSSNAYYFETSECAECTSLQIPQKWLRSWVATPEDGVANVLTDRAPWGRALLATLNALTPESIEDLILPGEMVSEQLAGLLTLAIAPKPTRITSRQRKLLPPIRQSLREHAHDELLTPEKIARAHAMSKRHLHALFAAAGTTFSKELMSIRLERGLRMLGDARFANINISDIAARCGFSAPSHFARRFHERYGVAPREHRKATLPMAVVDDLSDS